jgi:NTP pyrophosphatase (non-canonical NTP hydrolase)
MYNFIERIKSIVDYVLNKDYIENRNIELTCVIEECSEVQKEITKFLRGKGNIDNIIEEIADLEIVLVSLKYIMQKEYNISEEDMEKYIRIWKKQKLDEFEKSVIN